MDSPQRSLSSAGGGSDEHGGQSSGGRSYHRHSADQIAKLEAAFKRCAHPNERMRRQLGYELGLQSNQVKFWFQNKRTSAKTLCERSDNTAIRQDNDRMRAENSMIKEALKKIPCLYCGGPTLLDQGSDIRLPNLSMENANLKQEYERVAEFLASNNIHVPSVEFRQQQQQQQPPNVSSVLTSPSPSLSSSSSAASWLNPNPNPNPEVEIASLCQRIHSLNRHHHTSGGGGGGPAHHHDHQLVPNLDQHNNQDNLPAAMDEDQASADRVVPTLDQYNVPALAADFASVLGNLNSSLGHEVQVAAAAPVMVSAFGSEQRAMMEKAGGDAAEEVERLLRINEPFWFRSTIDGRFVLQVESYDRMFYKPYRLKGPRARRESSKDSKLVIMHGHLLVDTFLDARKWVAIFPTIVKKAYTIEVLNDGLPGSRSGALQLMYAEMHVLSPLVPSREFFFLRHCLQVATGVWVIADVSFDVSKFSSATSRPWRLPSGWLIHDMNDGSSTVTLVEHVEVDDMIKTHQMYRDLVCGGNAFGAERWILTLERMCERFAFASMDNIPSCDVGGVITLPEGRTSVMQLAQRMVKLYCVALDMSDTLEFPYARVTNIGGVRVCVRNSSAKGVPQGIIVSAATSFWLPLLPKILFDFLKDPTKRAQWDVLSEGNPMAKFQHISTGSHPDNCTSLSQPFVPNENKLLILQECCSDALGSMLVYSPVDISTISAAMIGNDTSTMPILPSGFIIALDSNRGGGAALGDAAHLRAASNIGSGPGAKLGGSLTTLLIQVLVSGLSSLSHHNMDSVTAVNALVTSTVEKIKLAFNCSEI